MKITVLDILEAHNRADEFDAVVTVIDAPKNLWGIEKHKNHIVEFFGDEEDERRDNAPTLEQVGRILDATAKLPQGTNLLVHCYAGMCRSTAVAIAIAVQHGMTPLDAAQHLLENHFDELQFWPNKLILKHASDWMNMPELQRDVIKWMRKLADEQGDRW